MTEANKIIHNADDNGLTNGLIFGGTRPEVLSGTISLDTNINRFAANAGEALILDWDESEIDFTLDIRLRLLDSEGHELHGNHDRSAPRKEVGLDPASLQPKESRVDYFGVSSLKNFEYDPIREETLVDLIISENINRVYQLERGLQAGVSLIDPDSNLSGAIVTGLDVAGQKATLKDVLEADSDVDIYQVQLEPEENLILGLGILNPESITNIGLGLRLFDETGAELNLLGNANSKANQPQESLVFTAPIAGNYFVGVSEVGNSDYDPVRGTLLENSDFSGVAYQLNLAISTGMVGITPDEVDNVFDRFSIIAASEFADNISGNAESTFIDGLSGDDSLTGAGNSDYFLGNRGNDTLSGNNGNDTLIGGADGDFLSGGNGSDVLQGDGGNNVFLGGQGADVFVIQESTAAFNIIADFEPGIDKIRLDDANNLNRILTDDLADASGVVILTDGHT